MLRPYAARIDPAERRIVDGHVEALVAEPDCGAVVLRVEHGPSIEHQPAGRTCDAAKSDSDAAIATVVGLLIGDENDVGHTAWHNARIAANVLLRIEQQPQRRVPDRPARHL